MEVDDTGPTLPVLKKGETLIAIRDPQENYYLAVILLANFIVLFVVMYFALFEFELFVMIAMYALLLAIALWISWKLTFAFVRGHSIEVGPTQYPQIYRVVKQASDILDVPKPTIFVMQSHGLFELLVAKRYTRRGLLIIHIEYVR